MAAPAAAPLDEIVDWKHPLLRRFTARLPKEAALLVAWRREQGYEWFFRRRDLDRLVRSVDRATFREGLRLGENFLGARPELPTTGERMRALGLEPESRLSLRRDAVAIDWNELESRDDVEWIHMVNRMSYLPPMALAARRGRRGDIAERVFEILDHWIANCPFVEEAVETVPSPVRLRQTPWHEMDTGMRIQSWLEALHILWDHPSLTPQRFARYVRSLRQHALLLGRTSPARPGSERGNHLIMETRGLMYWAILPWMREGPDARAAAAHNWRRCVYSQVLPDGGHCQIIPNYHLGSSVWLSQPLFLWRMNGWQIDPEAERRVRLMLPVAAHIMMPDRGLANFGNTNMTDDHWRELQFLAMLGSRRLPHRAPLSGLRTLYAGSLGSRPRTVRLPLAQWFPDWGYACARSSWTDDANAIFMHVSGGGSQGHSHSDWLSFLYACRGRRILAERGVNSYDVTPENLVFRLSRAHNVLQIGEREPIVHQNTIWNKFENARARMLRCRTRRDGSAEWTAQLAYIDGTRWERQVRFAARSGRLVIEDRFTGPRTDNTELRFHLNTARAKLLSDYECVTTDRGKPNVRVRVKPPASLANPLHGSRRWTAELTPVGLSPSFTKRERGLLLCFSCRVKAPATWITTIEPV